MAVRLWTSEMEQLSFLFFFLCWKFGFYRGMLGRKLLHLSLSVSFEEEDWLFSLVCSYGEGFSVSCLYLGCGAALDADWEADAGSVL